MSSLAQMVQNPEVWALLGGSGQVTLMVANTKALWRGESSPEIKYSFFSPMSKKVFTF